MGAKAIILAIWLIGFSLGFFAYFTYPNIANILIYWLPQIFNDVRFVGAFVSGLAGSIITTVAVILFAYFSKRP